MVTAIAAAVDQAAAVVVGRVVAAVGQTPALNQEVAVAVLGTAAAREAAAVTRAENAAETMVAEIASAAFVVTRIQPAIPQAAAITRRLLIVIGIGNAVAVIATATAMVIAIDIIDIVMAIEIGIATGIEIGDIERRAFTRPRITATIDMAQMPTTRVITTAYTPERMMPGADKATIRSARIFISMAPAGSCLSSEAQLHTAWLIAMDSCAVITRGFKTIRIISSAGVFTDSCCRRSRYSLAESSGSLSVICRGKSRGISLGRINEKSSDSVNGRAIDDELNCDYSRGYS